MRSTFSTTWTGSTQARKQRKYRNNAPLHIKGKFVRAPVEKRLREEFGRSLRVRKGDTVKVLRGSFKGRSGKVDRVDTLRSNYTLLV